MTKRKLKVELVVVIPVGPNDDAIDTIESVERYCGPSHAIVLLNDSGNQKKFRKLQEKYRNVWVVAAPVYPPGSLGGLFMKTGAAFQFINNIYNYQMVLRLDCDSLIIGERPETDALYKLSENSKIGMLGSYNYDCNGVPRSFSNPARRMTREIISWPINRKLSVTLLALRRQARINGYQDGEHCLGAAIFMTRAYIESMLKSDIYKQSDIAKSRLGDDHLYGLMCKYLGYEMADFATGSMPLGLKLRGLPDTPENLVLRGKKIVHSVKRSDIKTLQYFQKRRQEILAGSDV